LQMGSLSRSSTKTSPRILIPPGNNSFEPSRFKQCRLLAAGSTGGRNTF
jgi:hypothetical protein